jgi:REP element-mobilizing transposase RayT
MARFVNRDGVMARRKRIQDSHLVFHVMTRGNGRMTIFKDEDDHRYFLSLFSDVMQDFEIQVWNFCSMPNHTHATLQPTAPNLSKAMKRLNGCYAQWWNRRHDHIGHVFQDRFKSQVVQTDRHLLELCRYVPLNPVRARLVSSPTDWPWSSYGWILGTRPAPSFLTVDCTLRLFGDDDRAAQRARFAEFVGGEPDLALQDRFRRCESIVGDRAFKIAIEGPDRRATSLDRTYDVALAQEFRTIRTDLTPALARVPGGPPGTAPSAASSGPT